MDEYATTKNFLNSQIRLLSQSLHPASNWRNEERAAGGVSDATVSQVLYKLNTIARKHQKMNYSEQAIVHVTEQICQLYRQQRDPIHQHQNVVSGRADLTNTSTLESLPREWPDEIEEDQQLAYQDLLSEVSAKANALKALKQRYAQYKQLHDLLLSFKDPRNSVQPNLITKDGPVAKELDRMRILATKLAARIETVMASNGAVVESESNGRKVPDQSAESLLQLLP